MSHTLNASYPGMILQQESVNWRIFADTFHYLKKKIPFTNIATNILRKVAKYWEAAKLGGRYKFSKILIFYWNLNFITGNKKKMTVVFLK